MILVTGATGNIGRPLVHELEAKVSHLLRNLAEDRAWLIQAVLTVAPVPLTSKQPPNERGSGRARSRPGEDLA